MPQGANYLGSVVTGQTTTGSSGPSGNVMGNVDGNGGYWEKVSGLTMFVLPYGPTRGGPAMIRPQMGPQFGGGFGVASAASQLPAFAGHRANSGWTY